MSYNIYTKVTNIRGDVLYENSTTAKLLDSILDTDLANIYAEAQQKELKKGLDIPDIDEHLNED